MNQSLTQNEKMIAGVHLVVVAAFFGVFSLLNKATPLSKSIEGSRINYKMARPESPYSEYTLEGRELDAQYEGLPEEKVKELKKIAAKAKVADAKKKEAAKKQAEVKKQEAVRKAQTARTQKPAPKQLAALNKAKPVTPNPVSKTNNSAPYFQQADSNNVTPVADSTNQNKKKFADFRNMIFATPTPEVMGQIVAALRKGDISATEYQALAQDLLTQTDPKYQGIGLLALRSVPSLASLSQLVHAQPTLSAAYQAYVEQAYLAYFYPQNLSYFSAAIGTKDRVLQAKVLNLLSVNLDKLSKGDETVFVDARNQRSAANSSFTLSSFVSLIPSLKVLGEAGDQEFSLVAQQIADLIGTTNNVAQN